MLLPLLLLFQELLLGEDKRKYQNSPLSNRKKTPPPNKAHNQV